MLLSELREKVNAVQLAENNASEKLGYLISYVEAAWSQISPNNRASDIIFSEAMIAGLLATQRPIYSQLLSDFEAAAVALRTAVESV